MSDEALGRTLTAALATILVTGTIAIVAYCTMAPAHGATSKVVEKIDMTDVSAARRHRRHRFRVHRARRVRPAIAAKMSTDPVEQIEPECCWPKLEPIDWIVARWPDTVMDARAQADVTSPLLPDPVPAVLTPRRAEIAVPPDPWAHTASGKMSLLAAVLAIIGSLGAGIFSGLRPR